MSTYQRAKVRKLRLRSLEDIKAKLDIRELSSANFATECLTTNERVNALGDSISCHLSDLNITIKELQRNNPLTSGTVEAAAKVVSLHEALAEDKQHLLQTLVNRTLTSKDIDTINLASNYLKAGDVNGLSMISTGVETLLNKMNNGVRTAHSEITKAETEVLSEKMAESLNAMGYQVKSKSRGGERLIRGKKKDLSVAARITGGELSTDMAGFEGGACKDELKRLNEELSRKGIVLGDIHSEYHGKRDGGVLAQEASKEIPFEFNPLQEKTSSDSKEHIKRLMGLNHLRRRINR